MTAVKIKQVKVVKGCSVTASPVEPRWPDLGYLHLVRQFMTDICTGSDHITFNKVSDWSVTSGIFDPFYLFGASLKRYNNTNTQATQTLSGLQTGTSYSLSLSGSATVSFSGPAGVVYSWGSSTQIMSDQTVSIDFTTAVPTSISVKLNNANDEVAAVSMVDQAAPETELLNNIDFVNVEEHFYDIDSWYTDSDNEEIVPHDTLGWLAGFNDSQIFTIFDPDANS